MSNKIDKINPPQALVDQCNTINKDYLHGKSAILQLYFADDEFEGEWKFRIVDTVHDRIIVEHLFPQYADGHSYMLFMVGIEKAMEYAEAQGRFKAIDVSIKHQLEINNIHPRDYEKRMRERYSPSTEENN